MPHNSPYRVKTITAADSPYQVALRDDLILVDTTAGNVICNMPDALGRAGKRYTFVKLIAANTLTLDGKASDTINGAATLAITTQYAGVTLESNGANWIIVASALSVVSNVTLAAGLDSALLSISGQALGLDNQAANILFAGPVSGGAAAPGFRAVVLADLPMGAGSYTDKPTATEAILAAALTKVFNGFTAGFNGAVALAIPDPADVPAGVFLFLAKTGTAGAVTITPAGGTIGLEADHALVSASGDFILIVSDGVSNWMIVDSLPKGITIGDAPFFNATPFSFADELGSEILAADIVAQFSNVVMSRNGTQALAIPDAGDVLGGFKLRVSKTGTAGAITITPAGGLIAGGATHADLDAQGDYGVFESDGVSDWMLVHSVIAP